jgi:hypothetical protein
VRQHFGGFAKAVARGLAVRHDHGSQYMSDHFQKEIAFLGIESSPAFVRAPVAMAAPSGSSGRSRRTCCGCTASRRSRTCVTRCPRSARPTTPPG